MYSGQHDAERSCHSGWGRACCRDLTSTGRVRCPSYSEVSRPVPQVILPEFILVEVVIKEKGQLNASIVMRKG